MAQRIEDHPLDAAFSALLTHGLDGAGEALRIPALPLSADAAQADNLVDFVRNELANEGVEVFEGDSPEDFKTLIDEKLEEVLQLASASQAAPAGKIALIVDPSDIAASGVLTGLLCEQLGRDYLRLQVRHRHRPVRARRSACCLSGSHCRLGSQQRGMGAGGGRRRAAGRTAQAGRTGGVPDRTRQRREGDLPGSRSVQAASWPRAFGAELAEFLRAADAAS